MHSHGTWWCYGWCAKSKKYSNWIVLWRLLHFAHSLSLNICFFFFCFVRMYTNATMMLDNTRQQQQSVHEFPFLHLPLFLLLLLFLFHEDNTPYIVFASFPYIFKYFLKLIMRAYLIACQTTTTTIIFNRLKKKSASKLSELH